MGILNNEYNEGIRNGSIPAPELTDSSEPHSEDSAVQPEQQPDAHTFSANTETTSTTQERPVAAATPDRPSTFARTVQRRTRQYIAGLALGAAIIGGAVAHAASKTHSEPPHPQVGTGAPLTTGETSPTVDPTPTETSETPTTTTTPELPAETTGPLAIYNQEPVEKFHEHTLQEQLFYGYESAKEITDDLKFSDWFGREFPDGEILADYSPTVKPLDASASGLDIARQGTFTESMALGWMVNEDDDGSEHAPLNYDKAERLAYTAALDGSPANVELIKEIRNAKEAQPVREFRLAYTVEATSPLVSVDAADGNVNLKGKIVTKKFPADPAADVAERIEKDTYAYVPNGYGAGKNAWLLISRQNIDSKK